MEISNYGYIENGQIFKEYSCAAEGMVYKNTEAFNSRKGICYINSDNVSYTFDDFLEQACGNEEIAKWCFSMMVDTWNYPESYFDDGIESGYFKQCDCMYIYDHKKYSKCPKCTK